MSVLRLGTLALILGMSLVHLAGCAPVQSKATSRVIERLVYVPIPQELTSPLPVYDRATETFGEAWQQAERNTRTLERCNADRAAVQAIQGSKRDPGG